MKSLLVLAVFWLGAATAHAQPRYGFDPGVVYNVPRGASPSEGPADAPITVVAWSDFACTYCNRVQATLDQLQRLYPQQLRWVHRTLPLDQDNTLAAEAALAARAQGRFAAMKDRLYGIAGRVDRGGLELIAREIDLDMIRFRAALDARTYLKDIDADIADAIAIGVTGTPAFFINGRAVRGNQPLKVFVDLVDQELLRAAQVAGPDRYAELVGTGRARADTPNSEPGETPPLDPMHAYRIGLGLPGHQLGPDAAPVTIVEWADFQCPYCADTAPVLRHVHEKYGDKVRIIFRHFPLRGHDDAPLAAEAAVAAAEQGKLWPFVDQLWAHFGSLTRADLESFARDAGLDLGPFRVALDTRRYHDAVVAEAAAAAALGVELTPTLFVNGRPLVGGRDAAALDKVIDAHLVHTDAAIKQGVAPGSIYALIMQSADNAERADPSMVPVVEGLHIEPRPDDRARAVAAACRRHDANRARALAPPLVDDARRRAAFVCSAEGVDLP